MNGKAESPRRKARDVFDSGYAFLTKDLIFPYFVSQKAEEWGATIAKPSSGPSDTAAQTFPLLYCGSASESHVSMLNTRSNVCWEGGYMG